MVPTHVCSHLLLLLLLSTSVNSDESNEGIDDKQPSYEDDCLVVKTTDNNHQSSTIAMTRTDTLSSKRHRQLSASTPHYRYSTPSVPTSPSPPPFPTPFRKPTSLGHPERYPIPSAPYEPPSSRSPTKASNEPSIIFEPSASPSTSGDVCNKLDPNSEEFLNDTCCSRENRCEDYQYCIGVMMAHESAALSQCCDQYDSCSQFRELLRTMRYLRRLAIADTCYFRGTYCACGCAYTQWLLGVCDRSDRFLPRSRIRCDTLGIVPRLFRYSGCSSRNCGSFTCCRRQRGRLCSQSVVRSLFCKDRG